MSECKIKQNMEFGGIIYFILLLFFGILGIFNESKKKKALKQQENKPNTKPNPMFERKGGRFYPLPPPVVSNIPPPVVLPPEIPSGGTGFQSSVDQISNFGDYSSLEGSIYVDEKEGVFSYNYNNQRASTIAEPDADTKAPAVHPILKELHSEEGRDALKKGIIYGEIMQRKY